VPKELRFGNGLNFSSKLNPSVCEILITLYKLKSYLVWPVGCHNLRCWAIDIYSLRRENKAFFFSLIQLCLKCWLQSTCLWNWVLRQILITPPWKLYVVLWGG